jgi:hypothetical protein
MRVIKYFYYRVFNYYKSGDSTPFFSTFLSIFSSIFFHFLTILALIETAFNALPISIDTEGFKSLWFALVIVPIYVLYNQYFVKAGYHDQILNEFKNETKKQKRLSSFYTIAYFILTFVLFFFSLWLRAEVRGY